MCEHLPDWIIAIATVVYAFITLMMLCDNKKQLKALKSETRINSGLQLYTNRKRVLDLYVKKQYEKIAQDIAVLFGMDFYLRLDSVALKEKSITTMKVGELKNTAKRGLELEYRQLYKDLVEFVKESIADENRS